MDIPLNEILRIDTPEDYKLHLACRNKEGVEPLNVFVADREAWIGWNKWRNPKKNDWTRRRILAFMNFHPQADAWLFGGAFDVTEQRSEGYELESVPRFEKYVGRLLAHFHRPRGMRGRSFYLERYLGILTVTQILPDVYSGERFPGFENINHDFITLEAIFGNARADWKAALENAKGVYLVTDTSNGKKYVGSAYGNAGIWSRWASYILGDGHGWNDELVKLLARKGRKHAREYFRFTVLEVMTKATADEDVIGREKHWKKALLTREYGYNKN